MKEPQDSQAEPEGKSKLGQGRSIKTDAAIRSAEIIPAVVAIPLVFWWLQYSTTSICCGDFDGYYHIKWAQVLWQNMKAGHFLPPSFVWLPLTTLNPNSYVDHHLLYHIILIPFTWFRDLQTGAKISAVLLSSLAVLSCYWLIVRYRIRYPLIWLMALLSSSAPFLYRIDMVKAPPLAIIFLVISIYLLFERKFWPLLPLGFVFAVTYDLFVLLLGVVALWALVIGWTEKRFEWRAFALGAGGCLLGLIINPYFPRNLYLLYEHTRMKVLGTSNSITGVEWSPVDLPSFVPLTLVAVIAMVLGYFAFSFLARRLVQTNRPALQRPLFLLILSTALLIMNIRWKRFVEYFPPFAILFAAFTLEQFWELRALLKHQLNSKGRPSSPKQKARTPIIKELKPDRAFRRVVLVMVIWALGVVVYVYVKDARASIAGAAPRDYYANGATWMSANIPTGEMVFNTDWVDFPRLFFFDPNHVYVSGLDPNYLLDQDPQLARLYDEIRGGTARDPALLIRDRFGARWVFTNNLASRDFLDNALKSGSFDRVYQDDECSVLRVRDQRRPAP